MTSFGRYLAQQREERGYSPEEIIRITKLSPSALAALETGRFEELPGRAFVVGYIRAYASCIGLNPDEAVLQYRAMEPEREEESEPAPSFPSPPPLPIWPFVAMAGLGAGGLLLLVWFLTWL